MSKPRLFLILALVAIGAITTVYVGIFEPGQIGWGSTYTFDGILVATLVMVVFDTLIWPSPAEPRLLESIAGDLERIRGRFRLVGERYLDPFADPLPAPQITSILARNLALLKSVEEHTEPAPKRLASLLHAAMTAEHVYLEVERLAVLADEPYRTGSDSIIAKSWSSHCRLWREPSQRPPRRFSQVSMADKTWRNRSRTCG